MSSTSRQIQAFRFDPAFLLAGLIFGGLFLGLASAQAGSDASHCSSAAMANSQGESTDDVCVVAPVTEASICVAVGTQHFTPTAAGAIHRRYFPAWYNDTRKTRP